MGGGDLPLYLLGRGSGEVGVADGGGAGVAGVGVVGAIEGCLLKWPPAPAIGG